MAISFQFISCILISLVFVHLKGDKLKLTLNIKYTTAPTLSSWIPQLRSAMENYYITTGEYLSYPDFTPPSTINLTLDGSTDCQGSAVTSNNELYKVCTKHFGPDGPTENDLVTIVQATTWSLMKYPPPPTAPTWLTQCLVNYCRWTWWFKYLPNATNEIDKKAPPKPSSNVTSPRTASADECAYFINYVNSAYPKSPDVVQQINKQMRTGNYQDTDWEQITGKSGRELWDEMISQG